jgi:hypothetical protein
MDGYFACQTLLYSTGVDLCMIDGTFKNTVVYFEPIAENLVICDYGIPVLRDCFG